MQLVGLNPGIALQASQTPGLVVIAEEDLSKTLLIHKISADNNYQQSGGACTGF